MFPLLKVPHSWSLRMRLTSLKIFPFVATPYDIHQKVLCFRTYDAIDDRKVCSLFSFVSRPSFLSLLLAQQLELVHRTDSPIAQTAFRLLELLID